MLCTGKAQLISVVVVVGWGGYGPACLLVTEVQPLLLVALGADLNARTLCVYGKLVLWSSWQHRGQLHPQLAG